MKRLIAIMLAVSSVFALCACGGDPAESLPSVTEDTQEQTVRTEETAEPVYTGKETFAVPTPMARKEYTFDHTPTTDELRQMAVEAMRDELSVQWCVDRFFCYAKAGAVSGKNYSHVPQNVYAGMPYTNAGGSLIQWFEYYDSETGLLSLEGDPQAMNTLVGNSCAGCVCAGLITVCNSLSGKFNSSDLVPSNGFIPVGSYTFISSISSYSQLGTDQIIAENGEAVMYESYAQILPADALTSTTDVHAIMAIEAAHVVYKASGAIDPDQSYVVIQDQRAGTGDRFYTEEVDGVTLHYSGRVYAEYTFSELLAKGYIPLTTAEFLGIKAYETPEITVSKSDFANSEEMFRASVSANYDICVMRLVLVGDDGSEEIVERIPVNKTDNAKRNIELARFYVRADSLEDRLTEGVSYSLRVEVVVSNGQVFNACEAPL